MRTRLATTEDMPAVFMMGYDEWGEGAQAEAYVQDCLNSGKYKSGQWYVLEDDIHERAASLVVYKSGFNLPSGTAGIGSVATALPARRKGYAAALMKDVMAQLTHEGIKTVYLFSDIAPSYYERLGFAALPTNMQSHLPSVCMAKHLTDNPAELAALSYF